MSNEELTVNINMWPGKDDNSPLEIHTASSKNDSDKISIKIESNTTVPYPSNKQLLHPKEYCLKYHIYEKVRSLQINKDEVLIATYGEPQESDKRYDLENKLFYNIGTGAFSSVFKDFPKQIVFEKNYEKSSDRYLYKYEIIPEKKVSDMLKEENLIAEWTDILIGDTLPDKPDQYYAAIRNNVSKVKVVSTQTPIPGDASFAIKITLTVPESKKSIHPVSVMKHLLDGVICAFHGEDGEKTKEAVKERFLKNGLKDEKIEKFFETSKLNIFGKHNYLTKSNRWNPEDDRLQFGWIIVNSSEGEKYKMSGSIYKMNKKIIIKYMNNVCKKQITDFDIDIENETLLDQLIPKIENILKEDLIHIFNSENLYIDSDNQLVEFSPERIKTELTEKNEVVICYSEVLAPNNAARIDSLKLNNGSEIEFNIFPGEQNHRYSPHVQAVYNGNKINISISDSPKILIGKFEGNNHRKYEKMAIKHVKINKDFFMQKWNEFIKSQY